MPYVFYMENIRGCCIDFQDEPGRDKNGAKLVRQSGKQVKGTLALQIFEDRPYKRITFADPKNTYSAAAKTVLDYIGIAGSNNLLKTLLKTKQTLQRNDLIHFDFSEEDIKYGKKLIRFEIQMISNVFPLHTLACYDYNTHSGTVYMLPDIDAMKQWGTALDIHEAVVLADDGTFIEKTYI